MASNYFICKTESQANTIIARFVKDFGAGIAVRIINALEGDETLIEIGTIFGNVYNHLKTSR